MRKTPKKETLAEKIATVLRPAPATFESEDEDLSGNVASNPENDDWNEANAVDDEILLSKFRTRNVDLLADVDDKYVGKVGSRHKDEEDVSSDDETYEHQNNTDSEESDEGNKGSEDSTEHSSEGEDVDSGNNLQTSEFNNFNRNQTNQISKGFCVRNQMSIWENLLEMRIQLQKCLLAGNKMPSNVTYNNLSKEEEFANQFQGTQTTLKNLLHQLITLQVLLLKQYPETKKLSKDRSKSLKRKESDSASDIESDESDEIEKEEEPSVKVPRTDNYENLISQKHLAYRPYRNDTIKKWHEKTKITVSKSVQSHSILNQIDHILSDKQKLIKKTQLKRSNYKIIGEPEIDDENDNGNECIPEIYDDDDFYHQLLKELIDIKSFDITDSVQLSRQWIQLQSLRNKLKRKVDTKSTKGRKIRYAVHSKLLNFMPPIEQSLWTQEATNELYSSLFGKK